MHRIPGSPYVLGFALVAIAALIRYLLTPVIGDAVPILMFVVPVTVSAVYGGFLPGMFATVLSAAAAAYLFMPPIFSLAVSEPRSVIAMCTFIGGSLIISTLGQTVRSLRQRLEAANKSKDDFLAMLAHELRNPLAAISATAELLQYMPHDEKRLKKTGRLIGRQVDHMTKLVDDLLDVSRLTRGLVIIEKKPVDLVDVAQTAIEQTEHLFDDKAQQLTLKLPSETMCVCGDYVRLVQVVANLLTNSSRYSPQGAQVSLELHADAAYASILVRDSGIGLSAELLPQVFDLFVQGERSSDRSKGGLGLGLAIVKRIVGLHEGSVSVFSEGANRGSTFTIRLPRLHVRRSSRRTPHESPLQDPISAEAAQAGDSLHLLLADDNRDAAQALAQLLEQHGHTVAVEHDGRGALDRAHTKVFDVIVLDIGLPDIDGHELARLLRSIPLAAQSRFIALTGFGQQDGKLHTGSAGFDLHLTKPVHIKNMLKALHRMAALR